MIFFLIPSNITTDKEPREGRAPTGLACVGLAFAWVRLDTSPRDRVINP